MLCFGNKKKLPTVLLIDSKRYHVLALLSDGSLRVHITGEVGGQESVMTARQLVIETSSLHNLILGKIWARVYKKIFMLN